MAAGRVGGAFTLPPYLEAAEPPEARGLRRDQVRLLVSCIGADAVHHTRFHDVTRWLSPGDLLVVNTSGTLNAAVDATGADGERFELHLSTQVPGGFWIIEARQRDDAASRPFRKGRSGMAFELDGGGRVTFLAPYPLAKGAAGSRLWLSHVETTMPLPAFLDVHGRPIRYRYVRRAWPPSMYQTVFATEPGSAEMPSAGRPFTPGLVTRLVSTGVGIAPLLLHAGVASLEDHEPPYEEYYRISSHTAELANVARRAGRRVIAVGTTVVRALETVTDERGRVHPGEGWTSLVIDENRPLRAVTGMISGMHEPYATHLAIIRQAFAAAGSSDPERHLSAAYRQACESGYLWHEFGDSHLVVS